MFDVKLFHNTRMKIIAARISKQWYYMSHLVSKSKSAYRLFNSNDSVMKS